MSEQFRKDWEECKAKADQAAKNCVPTPCAFWPSDGLTPETDTTLEEAIKKGTVTVEADGECGGAYVVLPNWRGTFEKWVVSEEFGRLEKYPKNHVHVSASQSSVLRLSQSAARHEAWAEALVKALNDIGIRAYAKTYLT